MLCLTIRPVKVNVKDDQYKEYVYQKWNGKVICRLNCFNKNKATKKILNIIFVDNEKINKCSV